MGNYLKDLKKIKAFLFDVDGVFSKNFVVFDNGELYRIMNARDGLAVRMALEKGFYVGIITGGVNESVRDRFKVLGVTDVYLGHRHDKLDMAEDFCAKYGLSLDEVLYMGDDLPDYELMKAAGFSACPADAADEIKEIANYISDKNGGEGCVRDVVEKTLKVQNKWFKPGD